MAASASAWRGWGLVLIVSNVLWLSPLVIFGWGFGAFFSMPSRVLLRTSSNKSSKIAFSLSNLDWSLKNISNGYWIWRTFLFRALGWFLIGENAPHFCMMNYSLGIYIGLYQNFLIYFPNYSIRNCRFFELVMYFRITQKHMRQQIFLNILMNLFWLVKIHWISDLNCFKI